MQHLDHFSSERRRIVSYNFKGGVGKTTTVFNLASQLAKNGYRVLVIDADPQCNLTIHVQPDQPKLVADEPTLPLKQRRKKAVKRPNSAAGPSAGPPDSADSDADPIMDADEGADVGGLTDGPVLATYELPEGFNLEPFQAEMRVRLWP
jgi:hypothetical protein